ncbi:hypothetical protein [Sphingomonas sp. PP-CC-3A-396]|nr:hypothetical protein [Sphingomonas sp. PP-CC-3A-396]
MRKTITLTEQQNSWIAAVEQHVIYFRSTSYGIAVIRILHQRMDAGRHL